MSNDARIMTSLPSHPKTRKLIKRHGQAAGWNLLCLFLFARDNKPDGDFTGMASDDIELAADWQGDDGLFVQSLIEFGFLDKTDNGYQIHDWADHNPWAAGAKKRSESASRNAAKRWGGQCEPDAVGINPHSESGKSAMQSAQNGNAPSPSPLPTPSPSPNPIKKHTPPANAADPCPHAEIIALYHDHLPMMPVVREWTPARQTKLRARWKEKADRQSLDWWAGFFAYVAESDFLCGRTTKPFTCNLEWLITPTNFTKVIEGNYENRGVAA